MSKDGINKPGAQKTAIAQSTPAYTSENDSTDTPSDTNIPQNVNGVNSQDNTGGAWTASNPGAGKALDYLNTAKVQLGNKEISPEMAADIAAMNFALYLASRRSQTAKSDIDMSDQKMDNRLDGQSLTDDKSYDDAYEEAVNPEPDTILGKSVGAKAKNYEIITPEGEIFNLAEGSRITHVNIIAGYGRNRQIDILDRLVDNYGGNPQKWTKCKGFGYIDVNGENMLAEVHWYEEPSVGRVKFKIKPQPGGELFINED
jgi:hypothetical protein